MIEKQDPHLVKLNSSAPNQSHTHSIFKPVQKLALADNYAILQLAGKIRQEISGFKQSCFGLNNLKKANKLQQAFDRALTQVTKNTTPDEFLDYKEDDQESIREALSYNRIGFFDKPKSLVRIETQARVLSV